MRTESHGAFQGIPYKMVSYSGRDGFYEFADDEAEARKRFGIQTDTFEPIDQRPEQALNAYEASDIFLTYALRNPERWLRAAIIYISVDSGPDTIRFVEHCLNTHTFSKADMPFSEFPFQIAKAKSGRRMISMLTERELFANGPISSNERYTICIAEKAKETEDPWYQRLWNALFGRRRSG